MCDLAILLSADEDSKIKVISSNQSLVWENGSQKTTFYYTGDACFCHLQV